MTTASPPPIDLSALNADTEPWLKDPLEVNQYLRARIEVAKRDPYEYASLSLTFERERDMSQHGMHVLIHDAIAAARAAGKYVLIVAPPGSAKSKRAIKDAAIWNLAQNPGTYTSFVSYADEVSRRNLIWCRKSLVSPLTGEMWPHLRPDTGRSLAGGGWSTERLYLYGNSEPAFDAHTILSDRGGIGPGQIIFDDVVTAACKDSESTRTKVHDRFHNSWLPRLRAQAFALALGNCWHRDDVYHRLLREEHAAQWCVLWIGYEGYERIYWRMYHAPDTWPHDDGGYLPLWEENASTTRKKLMTIEASTWKRLYEQRATLVEEMRFLPVEKWPTWKPEEVARQIEHGCSIYGGEDISGGISLKIGDYAALGAVLIDQNMRMYVLDFWCRRCRVTEQIRALWMMHERLFNTFGQGFARCVVEALRHNSEWFRLPMSAAQEQLRKDGHPLWDLNWGFWTPPHNKSKNVLIDSMAPFLEAGTLMFPPDIMDLRKTDESWKLLCNQMEDFPPPPTSKTEHDDAPNALAIAVDEARRLGPGLPGHLRQHLQRVADAQTEIRDNHPLTGKPIIEKKRRSYGI